MDRTGLLKEIEALPDDAFQHVAMVTHDIARRMHDHHKEQKTESPFTKLGVASRAVLGLPEPAPELEPAPPAEPGPNDVTVGIKGVEGTSAVGGLH